MDTINQQHEFNGKIYKTLTSAKSARTRYRNKKIKELLQQEQTETIVSTPSQMPETASGFS